MIEILATWVCRNKFKNKNENFTITYMMKMMNLCQISNKIIPNKKYKIGKHKFKRKKTYNDLL